MNRLALAALFVAIGATLGGAEITGAYWSYSDTQVQVRRVGTHMRGDHIQRPWQLHEMAFVDYELADEKSLVFVRDGGDMLLDPQKELDPVLALRKKIGRVFRIEEVLCRSQGRFVAGILVAATRPAGEPHEPYYGTPSAYFSAEAADAAQALAAVKRIVLGSRFLPAAAREQVALDEEMKRFVIEDWTTTDEPNQPVQRNAGGRPRSDDSPVSETSSSLGPRG
jgi:hypothetical protein